MFCLVFGFGSKMKMKKNHWKFRDDSLYFIASSNGSFLKLKKNTNHVVCPSLSLEKSKLGEQETRNSSPHAPKF